MQMKRGGHTLWGSCLPSIFHSSMSEYLIARCREHRLCNARASTQHHATTPPVSGSGRNGGSTTSHHHQTEQRQRHSGESWRVFRSSLFLMIKRGKCERDRAGKDVVRATPYNNFSAVSIALSVTSTAVRPIFTRKEEGREGTETAGAGSGMHAVQGWWPVRFSPAPTN
jgi:hypothetical protein